MANATDKQGGPFIYAEGQNAAGQPDGTRAVIGPQISRETFMEDAQLALMVLYRSGLWHKGMNADLVDSKHAAYLTTAVNEDDVDHPDLNDSSPAAPSGGLNVKWQVATAQNTDSQTPVSAYVPFSSISTATAVSTDYVVITDTSDSNNPKRALVSDIITAVAAAPLDAQYVTLATNGTLTNERVLTPGTAIDITDAGAGSTVTIDVDLNELGVGTPAAADTFIFIDADDSVAKKGSAAATLTAIGGASSSTALTAAAALADKAVVVGAAADRTTVKSDFTMTHDTGNIISVAAGSGIRFDNKNLSDIGTISRSGNILQKLDVSAYASAGTTLTATTWVQVAFATEVYDTDSTFASSTYTPGVLCRVRVTAHLKTDVRATDYFADPDANALKIAVYYNGVAVKYGSVGFDFVEGSSTLCTLDVDCELDVTNVGHGIKIYAYSMAGAGVNTGAAESYFMAHRIN